MLGYTRKQINSYLQQALSGTVSGRISIGDPVADMGLPNITVLLDDEIDESSAYMVIDDDPCERRATITIEARALLADGTESPIDDLCLSVEQAIASATSLNSLCKDLVLQTTEYDLDDDELPIGLATLIYNGFYDEYVPAFTITNLVFGGRIVPSLTWRIYSTFNTSVAGKVTVIARTAVAPYSFYYSTKESAFATTHQLIQVDVPMGVDYEMFYLFESDSGIGDVAVFTESATLTDGITSNIVYAG